MDIVAYLTQKEPVKSQRKIRPGRPLWTMSFVVQLYEAEELYEARDYLRSPDDRRLASGKRAGREWNQQPATGTNGDMRKVTFTNEGSGKRKPAVATERMSVSAKIFSRLARQNYE